MGLKGHMLLSTALAGLLTGSAAWAQTADTAQPTTAAQAAGAHDNAVGEVVVTGIRRSLMKSLDVKKRADGVVEVISAEAVGKFPDNNLADSMSHIPGVTVDRLYGEGDRVSIDGTDPALNRTFIDGHAIASANWGGDPQDKSSRNFNYSYISPDIIGQLVLYKNPEAWLDEGSIGGTTIVNTRKPFDLPANTAYVSGGYQYNDRASEGNAKASVAYSWKNENSTLGFIGAVTYTNERLAQAGKEYYGYGTGADFLDGHGNPLNAGLTINGAAPNPNTLKLLTAARYPQFLSYTIFQQTRERDGFSGDISMKPLPNLQLDLSVLYIAGNYNNLSQAAYSYNVRQDRATAVTVQNGLVEAATFLSAPATGPDSSRWNGELDENYRVTAINNGTYDLAYKWDVAGFHITGDAGYTRATGGTRPEYLLNWRTQSGFNYTFNGKNTSLNYLSSPTGPGFWQTEYLEAVNGQVAHGPLDHLQTVPGYNGGKPFVGFQVGGIGKDDVTDGEVYGKADFERDVEFGPFNKLLFGGKYSTHENSNVVFGSQTYGNVANGNFSTSSLSGAVTPAGLFSALNTSGNATQFTSLTINEVVKEINSLPTFYDTIDQGSFFDVNEKVSAAYVQGNFKGDSYHGNIGVRVVNTEDDSKYFSNKTTADLRIVDTKHSYTKFLPSFNFSYDISPAVVFRVGAADVIARPRYADLAGAFSVSTTLPGGSKIGGVEEAGSAGSGGSGNPNLRPYESINYEASAEWYFKPNSLLSAELFYRDIKNYILSTTQYETLVDPVTTLPGSYSVTTPTNAGKAAVEGFSITYQWDIGLGFGVQTNYTFSNADTGVPFLSRHVFNVIPYYESGPWSARASFNYRSEYLTTVGALNTSNFTDMYRELDMQVAYHFTDKLAVTVNATNLLDAAYYNYSGTRSAPNEYYRNGRVFGVNFSYRQ